MQKSQAEQEEKAQFRREGLPVRAVVKRVGSSYGEVKDGINEQIKTVAEVLAVRRTVMQEVEREARCFDARGEEPPMDWIQLPGGMRFLCRDLQERVRERVGILGGGWAAQ